VEEGMKRNYIIMEMKKDKDKAKEKINTDRNN
jgi:hypothetical protein